MSGEMLTLLSSERFKHSLHIQTVMPKRFNVQTLDVIKVLAYNFSASYSLLNLGSEYISNDLSQLFSSPEVVIIVA